MTRFALTIALLIGATEACAQPVFMVPLEGTCYIKTNTLDGSGEPVTITGTPNVTVWEGGNTTPITGADTVTEDYTDNGATSHTGMHDIAIACTAANGFEVGKYYSVAWADDTLTADSVAIDDRVIAHIYISATINVSSGVVEANVKQVNGTTQTAGDVTALVTTVDNVADAILDDTGTSGVRLSVGTGTGQISLSSGGVSLANTNITTVVGSIWNAPIASYSATPNSVAEALAGIWTDTNAVDTQTEMRTFLTGADSPVLAEDNLPSNFSSLEINGSGAVDSMLQGFLDNTIAESTANNIATNFEVFFDNGDAVSTSIIDDVQSGGLDAAGVRAALGMAAADLDIQLDGIVGYVDDIGVAGAGLSAVPWNASWDAEVQSEAQDALTASIGANGASLSAIPWNATWDAEVQSEADDALVANHLDHLFAADYDPVSKPGTATALLNELIESDGGVSRFTANALEESPAAGTTQPRINYLPSVKLKLATRNDGAYVCDKPVRVIAGTFDIEKAVGIDCSPFFGRNVQVETVGTCTVSGGSITATGLGPRDEFAMIQLDGTATAGDEVTVDCELTMDNGDKIIARFTIEVGE